MTGIGSTSGHARNTSTCTAQFRTNIGDRHTLKRASGPNLSRKARMSIRPHKFADVLWLGRTAGLVQKASSKTQFCDRVQKLLPKVSFTVVLSAPEKRPAASIATWTSRSNYENRAASSTNANAFSASGCRSDKNQADRKRRFGPEILSNPLPCGSGSCRTDPGEI